MWKYFNYLKECLDFFYNFLQIYRKLFTFSCVIRLSMLLNN